VKPETVVCPLGRYGKCYRLDSILYMYYKWFTYICYGLIGILGGVQFLVKGDHLGSISWPHNVPGEIAIALCIATAFGQISIASRGQIASSAETEARLAETRIGPGRRLHRGLAVISGLFLLVLIIGAIIIQFAASKPIQLGEAVLLALALAGLAYLYQTRRRKHDP
jgi:hypothetical protein